MRLAVVTASSLLLSCSGVIDESLGGENPPATSRGAVGVAVPHVTRLLTVTEYRNTVFDLFGVMPAAVEAFADDELAGGFPSNTVAGPSAIAVEYYLQAAEQTAAAALASGSVASCNDDLCAHARIEQLGRKIFRRPLDERESESYRDRIYGHLRATIAATPMEALQVVIQAMLQSPHFLYRLEWGLAPNGLEGSMWLSSFELATRLSYFLWQSTPDEELLRAAEAGELNTNDGIESQARRMLEHERSRATVRDFHRHWLEITELSSVPKDWAALGGQASLLDAMAAETDRFVEHVVFDSEEGTLRELLAAEYTFADSDLAAFYGVAEGGVGAALEKVAVPHRAGVFTQASVMARHAGPGRSSPARRGRLLYEQLLCRTLPAVPDDVDTTVPLEAGRTTREIFSTLTSGEACASCHQPLNTFGFAFEHYDAIGRHRASEAGQPVDASGVVRGVGVADGSFDDATDLMKRLATSETVRHCVTQQWLSFALGRELSRGDDPSITASLSHAAANERLSLRELLIAITLSPAFQTRGVDAELQQ